jgi:cell division protein FtsB
MNNNVLHRKCEVLKEGFQDLRNRLEDIEDVNHKARIIIVDAIQNLQTRMTALERQVDILSGE